MSKTMTPAEKRRAYRRRNAKAITSYRETYRAAKKAGVPTQMMVPMTKIERRALVVAAQIEKIDAEIARLTARRDRLAK